MPWMMKAAMEARRGVTSCVMALNSPDTAWWELVDSPGVASEIRLLRPRVHFVAPLGIKQSSNARTNALVVFRPVPANKPTQIWQWNWVLPDGMD